MLDYYYYSRNRHKVFISYYHHDDQCYKNYLDRNFGSLMINKSVMDGEYDPDNKDEYIKRLIREEKISDSSVIVVLVGPNTKKRKHVDWEIYAGLMNSNGNSGLVGVLLPEIRLTSDGKYYTLDLPGRLADNVDSGYAEIYTWDYFINHFSSVIERTFNRRSTERSKIDNSREQMHRNAG